MERKTHQSLEEIPEKEWASLGRLESPFLSFAWMRALENSGSASPDNGWFPIHLGLWEGESLKGALPVYAKAHSMGEFVYDWAWAAAAERLRVPYYPKLVVGVPFTPVTGPRFLLAPSSGEEEAKALLDGLHQLRERVNASGVHVQFCTEEEAHLLKSLGGTHRVQLQYHWVNSGYRDFQEFLACFRSKRRKSIRRERQKVSENFEVQVRVGQEITSEDLEAMYGFYRSTCQRYGAWDYLTQEMWLEIYASCRASLVFFFAMEGDVRRAGSFCVRSEKRLFGRYWGSVGLDEGSFVHFELCCYAPIEWAIREGLDGFEPGQGGRHKLSRGFVPTICHSVHWIENKNLALPIGRFVDQEREQVLLEQRFLMERMPEALRVPLGLRAQSPRL